MIMKIKTLIAAGAAELDDLAALATTMQFEDPINIQFTSGTTGAPKGATLTHHNIVNNGFFVGEAMRLTEHDRLCIPMPLYHCFGMVLGNLKAHFKEPRYVRFVEAFPMTVTGKIQRRFMRKCWSPTRGYSSLGRTI